jgi:hypothetical protein
MLKTYGNQNNRHLCPARGYNTEKAKEAHKMDRSLRTLRALDEKNAGAPTPP